MSKNKKQYIPTDEIYVTVRGDSAELAFDHVTGYMDINTLVSVADKRVSDITDHPSFRKVASILRKAGIEKDQVVRYAIRKNGFERIFQCTRPEHFAMVHPLLMLAAFSIFKDMTAGDHKSLLIEGDNLNEILELYANWAASSKLSDDKTSKFFLDHVDGVISALGLSLLWPTQATQNIRRDRKKASTPNKTGDVSSTVVSRAVDDLTVAVLEMNDAIANATDQIIAAIDRLGKRSKFQAGLEKAPKKAESKTTNLTKLYIGVINSLEDASVRISREEVDVGSYSVSLRELFVDVVASLATRLDESPDVIYTEIFNNLSGGDFVKNYDEWLSSLDPAVAGNAVALDYWGAQPGGYGYLASEGITLLIGKYRDLLKEVTSGQELATTDARPPIAD